MGHFSGLKSRTEVAKFSEGSAPQIPELIPSSLNLTTDLSGLPEPANVALAIFAFLLVGAKGASLLWEKRRCVARDISGMAWSDHSKCFTKRLLEQE